MLRRPATAGTAPWRRTSSGPVMRRSEMRSRYSLLHPAVAHPDLRCAGADHAFHARAPDDAGQDGVDADVGRAEFLGQALGETDHAPFGGRIRRAERVAEAPGRRGQVDDRALRRLPSASARRDGCTRNWPVRQTSIVRRQSAGVIVLDTAGWPGDAGVVDQGVEPAQRGLHLPEQPLHRLLVGDIAQAGAMARMSVRGNRRDASRRRRTHAHGRRFR